MPVFMRPAARALRRPAATGFERSVVTAESKRPPLSLAVHHVLFSLLSFVRLPPSVALMTASYPTVPRLSDRLILPNSHFRVIICLALLSFVYISIIC